MQFEVPLPNVAEQSNLSVGWVQPERHPIPSLDWSSQVSVPQMYPSPQTVRHESGVIKSPNEQLHPDIDPMQLVLHPAVGPVKSEGPSSHVSAVPGTQIPSPQYEQTSAVVKDPSPQYHPA